MNTKIIIASLITVFFSSTTIAAPVEFDTPDAHVIVLRSIDSWSGNTSISENMLDGVKEKEGAFQIKVGEKKYLSAWPTFFQGIDKDPLIQNAAAALKEKGFKLANSNKFRFFVDMPRTITPKEFPLFAQKQRTYYNYSVVLQGNPGTLPDRISNRKFLGGVIALATIGIGADKFGLSGGGAVLGSGIADSAYELGANLKASLSPVYLPDFDASKYKSIDVRRVEEGARESPVRVGQVIIAYKNDKTEEAEKSALVKAIISLAGADTTVDEVKKSWEEDRARRQAIWDECVALDKCKKEE